MKKVFSLFAVLLLIIAAGCKKQEITQDSLPQIPSSFTSDIQVTYGELEMTATVTKNEKNEFVIDFHTPEALSPLTVTYSGSVCSAEFDGLKFETDINRFPQTEMGALAVYAITDVIEGFNVQKTYSDGIITYKGTGERGSFTLTQDAESTALIEFKTEGANLHIVFSNFRIG